MFRWRESWLDLRVRSIELASRLHDGEEYELTLETANARVATLRSTLFYPHSTTCKLATVKSR